MSPRGQVQNEHMRTEGLAKITNAALEVFAEYGYHGATMKQIARATGLSYGLVYHYFPSKAKIFRHLVDFALESSMNAMDTALNVPGTAWEKIENLSKILVKNARSPPRIFPSFRVWRPWRFNARAWKRKSLPGC
jgi:AcrR family transcriptional regulator